MPQSRSSESSRSAYRQRPRATHRARRTAIIAVLAFSFLLTLLLAAFASSPSSHEPAVPPSAARLASAGPPLPQIMAVQGDLRIQLPISQATVTAIGYHGGDLGGLALDPVGQQSNEGLFSRLVHWVFGGRGTRLRYYRMGGGEGPPTGAVDVGAPAGTDVYSPVDGTVVSIRDDILNGRPYGNVIEIEPSGAPSVVVSLTRLRTDPALAVGSAVVAGSTKVGTVVDLSTVEEQALARHTRDAGNHVTLEVHPAAALALR